MCSSSKGKDKLNVGITHKRLEFFNILRSFLLTTLVLYHAVVAAAAEAAAAAWCDVEISGICLQQ